MPRSPRPLTQPPQRGGRSRPREAVPRMQRPLTLSRPGVRDRTRAVLKAFELQLV
ncbi:transcriptional regulator [Xanthomonas sp. XNM01]|nr:transcriptional regulator [Xanthomonas sp. XNM01]